MNDEKSDHELDSRTSTAFGDLKMATLTTKYNIGDVVYRAGTVVERKQRACPDCLGSKAWKAISPAGSEFSFRCPRCSAGYSNDRDMSLDYSAHVPSVSRLTIGSIQVNTAPGSWDAGNKYMCNETGIGSGNIYSENDLFETEEEALAASEFKAKENDKSSEWIIKLFDKTLDISDYQLESAALKLAKEERSKAGSLLWNLGDLFEAIEGASNKEEILEVVHEYKTYDWSRDKKSANLPGDVAETRRAEGAG